MPCQHIIDIIKKTTSRYKKCPKVPSNYLVAPNPDDTTRNNGPMEIRAIRDILQIEQNLLGCKCQEESQKKIQELESQGDDYRNKWDNSLDELEQIQEINRQLIEQLNIEREHAIDIDKWYRRFIHGEWSNEILQFHHESHQKSQIISKLEKELTTTQQLADREIKDILELSENIRKNREQLKQLRGKVKDKLTTDTQKIYLKNLLTAQEQLVCLEGASEFIRSASKNQLATAKRKLEMDLSSHETNNLCQLQIEMTKLEKELQKIKEVKLIAQIEVPRE